MNIKKLIPTLSFVALMGAVSPLMAEEVELRISLPAPEESALSNSFRLLEERMEAAFPGVVDVSVHASSSLFKQGTELPAMQRGNLEMASIVAFEIENQMPEYGVFGAAYLFRDPQHMVATFRSEIGQKFFQDVSDKMGIVILDAGYLGTRNVNLNEVRDVKGPSDLAGAKMRMPPGPTYQTLATALGATPVSMPITEVYLALKTGSIDGQDNPTNLTRDWKFNEVTKQVVLTEHLVQPIFYTIAKPVFDGLNTEQQTALRAAAREAVDQQIQATIDDELAAIETFREQGLAITEVDTTIFRDAVWAVYAENGATEAWMPGLVDQIKAID